MTIEVKGQQVHPHRYSLCWAAIETYHPQSAEKLAKTRSTRERNKAAREEQAFGMAWNGLRHGTEACD